VWRAGEFELAPRLALPTGHDLLDRELPGGGWPAGALSEVLHDEVGIGEVKLLSEVLARSAGEARLIAWIDPPHLPYAPGLALAGVPLARCLIVQPASQEDALWAAEQALRSGACGAVLLWPERRSRSVDYAWLRRLQMAAEAGRSVAVLFRSTAASGLPTPAHLRVVAGSQSGALSLQIPKRRGPPLTRPVVLHAVDRPRTAVASPPARGTRLVLAHAARHR
jgi:cell division inhibitor SulA/protein ImuA